uniref:Uncharacterized protein n=1 Tax=Anguilla anguilla TaxID=7936 RepID=A0A0E9R4T9_ANGAN
MIPFLLIGSLFAGNNISMEAVASGIRTTPHFISHNLASKHLNNRSHTVK